jgi:hypothetical protein
MGFALCGLPAGSEVPFLQRSRNSMTLSSTLSSSFTFIPAYDFEQPEPSKAMVELAKLRQECSDKSCRPKGRNPLGLRRVDPESPSSLIGARAGRGQRAKRPAAAARIRKIINKILSAFHATTGAAGRARNRANSVLQHSAQKVRASFRRTSTASMASAASTPSTASPAGNASLNFCLNTESGMKTAFMQTIQDALKNSAATAGFSGPSFSLQELDDALGSQTKRPLRSLVTGMKMALGTVLSDDTGISARSDSPVPRFDPVRAALRSPALQERFDALLRDFPEVENVYARLTPWGNGDPMEKKLDAMADAAAQAGSTPPVYFLVYQAAQLRDDIQYARRFLEALVADLGTA